MSVQAGLARWWAGIDPRLIDWVLALSLGAAGCVAGAAYHPQGWPRFDAMAYALSIAVSLPLVLRRRFPLAVLVVSCAVFTVYLAAGDQPSVNTWGPLVALYSLAAHRRGGAVVAGAVLTAGAVLYSGLTALPAALAVTQSVLAVAVIWVFGAGARRLTERNARLAELTALLRAEQEERARRAVMDERVRIARELHDVVAHHMSVVSVQAGLARYVVYSDPDTARRSLDTIAATSGEALEEMRRLLAVLRIPPEDAEDAAAYDPAPGLSRLDELAARVRDAGVRVEVAVTGTPRPLAPGQDQCVFRVIQESLTNVIKHAAPARAWVDLRYESERLVVRVVDDGRRRAPAATERTPPHGLLGMRERARLYGGTLSAGPRPQGGFEVVLTLPVPGPADA
ncbi:sensor histidine kinase [Actinoallomurus spadix]|uniref:sensor histidine kinase n=1 Tax=Actinoallomurus spadix TaxID=79912 RepID=UPI002092F8EC|nr:sensor histidine kinase [Actinoallomurus spadix]MCO5990285.1 sensor histidine kinase [Actinoallomurus spadix]